MEATMPLRALLLLASLALGAAEPPIIPRPREVVIRRGGWEVRPGMPVRAPEVWRALVEGFRTGFAPGQFALATRGQGLLLVQEKGLAPEGYRLDISPEGIRLAASTQAGAFYGLQSLRQLMGDLEGAQAPGTCTLPAISIQDAPRFPWRGLHLDVSRHFVSMDELKRTLDRMARLKLNTFHWHLTDTGGWRLESRKYPKLTTVGAWRRPREPWDQSKMDFPGMGPEGMYGGFYTQAEAREIVRYAAARHITVIPEIELPGHQIPVFFAYPELACQGTPAVPGQVWRHAEFCVGQEATFRFLEHVLTEVMTIFPSKVIHIGGDEVDKTAWKACPRCQQRMKDKKLENPDALQSWTIRRMERFLNAKGRTLMGWDEILDGGLAPNAMVMSWRGESGGITAAQAGHPVVMTPGEFLYLDQPEPARPMEKVYGYDPVPAALSPEASRWIRGAEACVWTEYMPDLPTLHRFLWPRLAAVAEVCWTPPARKDWRAFQERLPGLHRWLQREGVAFHLDPPRPSALLLPVGAALSFAPTAVPGLVLRHTMDGTEPKADSPAVVGALRPDRPMVVTARYFSPEGPAGASCRVRVAEDAPLAEGKAPGLQLEVRRGLFARVGDLDARAPERTLVDGSLGMEAHRLKGPFALRWTGFLRIEVEGLHTFHLESDDGSLLALHGWPVVDNDGLHGPALKRGSAWLRPGLHPIEIRYFDAGGGARFDLQVEGPGIPRQPLTPDRLYH